MATFAPALGFRSSKREHRIVIIDGPNMTNLGARNKRVYGAIASLEDLQNFCKNFGAAVGVTVATFASNYEGAILEFIHQSAQSADAYIINPAGLTVGGVATKHALTETGRPSRCISRTSSHHPRLPAACRLDHGSPHSAPVPQV